MDKIFGANLEFVREDDYVEYFLFPKLNESSNTEECGGAEEQEVRKQLQEVQGQCMKFVEKLIKERQYIWHKDEFQLRIRTCTKQEMLLNDESTATKEKATNSKNAQEGKQNIKHIIIINNFIISIIINFFCLYSILCLYLYVSFCFLYIYHSPFFYVGKTHLVRFV